MKLSVSSLALIFAAAAVLPLSQVATAQTVAPARTAPTRTAPARPAASGAAPLTRIDAGGMTIVAKRNTIRANGMRLDGNVRIVSPGEMDAAADAVALDLDENGRIGEIRAVGNVRLKVDTPARAGSTPIHVESSSRQATLDPKTRTLTLTGNVGGWYQPKGGVKIALSGEKVTVRFATGNSTLEAEAGPQKPVAFVIPVEDTGSLAGIGSITVSAKKANLNDGSDSTFAGAARAFSTGARKFDVTAESFVMTRSATGDLATLQTKGRTTLITDLPPNAPGSESYGTPVSVQVSSDSALVKPVDNTITFDGNVTGHYVLQNAAGARTRYPLSGQRLVMTLVPATATTKADFAMEFTGEPAVIKAPSITLGL